VKTISAPTKEELDKVRALLATSGKN